LSFGTLTLETSKVFEPLLAPARYKAAYGGRGSGKSWFYASLMVMEAVRERGFLGVCIREYQKTLRDSSKRLIEGVLARHGIGESHGFRTYVDRIGTPGDGVLIFQGMADHTAESIKSLEGFKRAWVDEGQTLSQRSLDLLRPTIRVDDSEIWFSWNPTRKYDPVDKLFRDGTPPTGAVIVNAGWRDNVWWNSVLEQERLDCFQKEPDQYGHIYEGEYQRIAANAYYATQITQLRAENRIGRVAPDPLMTYRACWDIGGTGAKADHTVIWVAQFVGREIRVLDHYEARGQPLSVHIDWLRNHGYGKALCVLPHDGAQMDKVHAVSYESFLRQAGFEVQIVENQGKGAAAKRIEATRRLFPRVWINEATCAAGVEALAAYHPRVDADRQIDLGPEHDWASHAADAFGLMCVVYEEPEIRKREAAPVYAGAESWMG
jgi:phage terminase large subunit